MGWGRWSGGGRRCRRGGRGRRGAHGQDGGRFSGVGRSDPADHLPGWGAVRLYHRDWIATRASGVNREDKGHVLRHGSTGTPRPLDLCGGATTRRRGCIARGRSPCNLTAVQPAGNATVTPTLCVSGSRSSGTVMVSV